MEGRKSNIIKATSSYISGYIYIYSNALSILNQYYKPFGISISKLYNFFYRREEENRKNNHTNIDILKFTIFVILYESEIHKKKEKKY